MTREQAAANAAALTLATSVLALEVSTLDRLTDYAHCFSVRLDEDRAERERRARRRT